MDNDRYFDAWAVEDVEDEDQQFRTMDNDRYFDAWAVEDVEDEDQQLRILRTKEEEQRCRADQIQRLVDKMMLQMDTELLQRILLELHRQRTIISTHNEDNEDNEDKVEKQRCRAESDIITYQAQIQRLVEKMLQMDKELLQRIEAFMDLLLLDNE